MKNENENWKSNENLSKIYRIEKQKILARMKEKKTSTKKNNSAIVFRLHIALNTSEKCVKISKEVEFYWHVLSVLTETITWIWKGK